MKPKHRPLQSAPVTGCGDQLQNNPMRRRWFALGLGGLLFTSVFALSAPLGEAQCSQWNVGGKWRFKQGSTNVDLDLDQNGTVITGKANHRIDVTPKDGGPGIEGKANVRGSVDGTVKGDQFSVHIYWTNNTVGVYDGTIRPSGRIEGTGYNQVTPSIKVNWYSTTQMECADAAPATTAPAPPPKSAAPAVPPGWAGRWETRTALGGHFEIIFVQNGDNVRGAFTDLNGNPQYNGSLSGDVSGAVLLYEYTQPGMEATGKGMFQLESSGKVITGNGVANDAARTKFKWWGWKTN